MSDLVQLVLSSQEQLPTSWPGCPLAPPSPILSPLPGGWTPHFPPCLVILSLNLVVMAGPEWAAAWSTSIVCRGSLQSRPWLCLCLRTRQLGIRTWAGLASFLWHEWELCPLWLVPGQHWLQCIRVCLSIYPFVSSRAVRNSFLPDTNDRVTLSPDHLDTCNDGDDQAGDDDTEDTTTQNQIKMGLTPPTSPNHDMAATKFQLSILSKDLMLMLAFSGRFSSLSIKLVFTRSEDHFWACLSCDIPEDIVRSWMRINLNLLQSGLVCEVFIFGLNLGNWLIYFKAPWDLQLFYGAYSILGRYTRVCWKFVFASNNWC